MDEIDTFKPWHDECELCYGKHPFKAGDFMFKVEHEYAPGEHIIICQVCFFRSGAMANLIRKATFK